MMEIRGLATEVVNRLFAAANQKDRVVLRPGTKAVGILRVAASVAEGETVTIGSNVFEVDIVNTDSTVNTSGGDLNNTSDPVSVTWAAHGKAAGDLFRVENEILKILRVLSVNEVVAARGRSGTAAATHADGLDIFHSVTPPAANIPVGLVATLTPAAFTPALVDEIINAKAGGERATAKASTIYGTHTAVSLQTGAEMLLEAVSPGVLATALAETLAGANNLWSAAAMAGGSAAAIKKIGLQERVPTASEVALGFIRFSFDFTPTFVRVSVRTTATGVPVAWVGGWSISGGRVSVDNIGATDWAATDTVTVEAWE